MCLRILNQLGLAPEQNSTSLLPKPDKKESSGLIDERSSTDLENSEEDGRVKMTIGNKAFNLGREEESNPEENASQPNEKE